MSSEDEKGTSQDSGNEFNVEEEERDIVPLQDKAVGDEVESDGEEAEYIVEILTPVEVVNFMNNCIKEVNSIVQIPPTITRILLSHFNWDTERLLESYYDGDPEKIFKDAHIVNPQKVEPANEYTQDSADVPKLEECKICYRDDVPESMMMSLQCGDRFCLECWLEYLTLKIMKEGCAQTISCPAHKCDILVDDSTVMSILSDENIIIKYQHLITRSFVECHRLLRWCSNPECPNVMKVQYLAEQPVTCTCKKTFCIACGNNWHAPLKCLFLKMWLKKCQDESETANYLAANTKDCPKCGAPIEKNGGCNHMTCRNVNCKHNFCWVCMGDWRKHGAEWYKCNRYDEQDAVDARDAQERSRAALTRYLFYCNRYTNHMKSLKFENKLYESVQVKMDEMQSQNMTWIEVQFLKKAVDALCQCRETLMYTYAFAFYLRKNNESEIFEDNQSDLERATEQLSEFLEQDLTKENLSDIVQKVKDKIVYCEQRRKVLLDHVREGYKNNLWLHDINKPPSK